MEKRQENRIGFRSQKKTTKWIWWWKAKPGDKKAVMEMYFTNGINICLKDRFQCCTAKEQNEEYPCFFAVEWKKKKLVTDDLKNRNFK